MRIIWVLIALGFFLLMAFVVIFTYQIRESVRASEQNIQAIRQVFDVPPSNGKPQVRIFNE